MFRAARLAAITWCTLSLAFAATDPWLRIKSPNFELFTTAGERSGRDLIRHFEQVRTFFMQALGSGLTGARTVRIVAFRNDKEFEPYRPNEVAAAFYHPGFRRDTIVMRSAASECYPLAVHEYTHLLVKQSGLDIPLWLNEGLAELYSTIEAAGSQIMVGKADPGVARTFNSDKWIDLHDLVAVGHDSPLYNEKAHAGMFYAESWALTHMLYLDAAYSGKTSAMLGALAKGAGADAAFRLAFSKSIEKVQDDLRFYLGSGRLNALLFNLKWDKAADTPEISEGSLRARLSLAELTAELRGKSDRALQAYEALARDYPKNWEVEEGWAEALWHQAQPSDAAQHFGRAAELGCNDARAFVEYGHILTALGRDEDAVVALKTAARLSPATGEVHKELAMAMARAGNYREAIAEFTQVEHVDAADAAQYFYFAAYAYYRIGEFAHAREALAKIGDYAKTERNKQAIESLQAALDSPALVARAAGPVATAASPAASENADAPPRLLRRPPPKEMPPDTPTPAPLPVVEGKLQAVDCRGKTARLRVLAAAGVVTLEIPDPENVTIRSGDGASVELSCGPQRAKRIRVEFEAARNPAAGVAGVVRSIEFL